MNPENKMTIAELEAGNEQKYKCDGYWSPPLDRIVACGDLVISEHFSLSAAKRCAAKNEEYRVLAWDGYGQPPAFRA